jgi:phage tail sheath protein FI
MANSVFVSPGVYTSEKDLTFVTRQVGVTTLGLVGETTQGPAFNPVFITNYDEYKKFFGGLDTTKITDNGSLRYELSYIAKSYLSQSNQLFVTRVLGLSGYDAGNSWGIVLDAALDTSTIISTVSNTSNDFISYSAVNGNVIAISTTNSLIQTLYTENSEELNTVLNLMTGKAGGDTGSTTQVLWSKIGSIWSGVTFDYYVISESTDGSGNTIGTTSASTIQYYSGTSFLDVENKIVATLRSRAAYDGNETLNFQCTDNTDVKIDTSVVTANENPLGAFRLSANSQTQGAKLYDVSFDTSKVNYITRVLGTNQFDSKTSIYVEEVYQNMLNEYNTSNKVKGIKTILINYSNLFNNSKSQYTPAVTPYFVSEVRGSNIIRLFRLWTISDGNTANSQIKISIENIQPDALLFDVVIRSFYDTDAKPQKLEAFTKCTMDSSSNDFIGRRIGTLDGEFTSNSNYVLVELDYNNDFNNSFPAGFLGVPQRDSNANSNTGIQNPTIKYKTEYGTYDNIRKVYLGLSDTIGVDQNFFNYKGAPQSGQGYQWTALTQGFHMDSGATIATIDGVADSNGLSGETYQPMYTFVVGNAEFRTDAGIATSPSYTTPRACKFTCAPYGGFDGWDIYRSSRTNTDKFSIQKYNGRFGSNNGVFNTLSLSTGANGINSDYYAYFEAMRTFANPEAVNINIFATPGIDLFNNGMLSQTVIDMIESDRADSLYITTLPDTNVSGEIMNPADVVDQLNGTFDSNYTCTYWPWIQINDAENNQFVWLSPTRDVVRNIARTDNIAYPWFAAAGVNRGDVDCIKSRVKLTLDQRDTLYEGRINPIATFASEGVKIWGNKTLQVADTALNRINVRRLLLQTRKLISAVSIRLLFEQNDDIVRNQFLSLVNPILDGIRAERGITDFRVTVSNDPTDIDKNQLVGKIYIKPTRALEYIIVDFNIMPTGASFANI